MEGLDALAHVEKEIKSGGTVLVLDTGAAITPPAQAMLAALHSRSIGGIKSHLKVLQARGSEQFMGTYYVGYGHKSIGDLGSLTVFIEGVSMLAAKAVQDSRLYNGQEASTRYIDFKEQAFIDPVGLKTTNALLESQRAFYTEGITELEAFLFKRFPLQEEGKERAHKKALEARAFDIMRSFLPAGASTNLAWHGPIRVLGDRLPELRNHPLPEVRNLAASLHEALYAAFPDSFKEPGKTYPETEEYINFYMEDEYYFDKEVFGSFCMTRNDVSIGKSAGEILRKRPNGKTELPKWLEELGTIQFEFLLDFGSFRDVQRHRAVVQRMPLLTTHHGFERWPLEQMPETLRERALVHLEKLEGRLADLAVSPEMLQYYIPMGYRVANRITGGLPALVYLIELRAQTTVHPTLRVIAQKMGRSLEEEFGDDLPLFYDKSPDTLDIRRGEQDIVKKEDA